MRPYLNAVTMDILNQAIVCAMAHVDVVETETLPATNENTNDYILNVYMTKVKNLDAGKIVHSSVFFLTILFGCIMYRIALYTSIYIRIGL